MPHCRILSSTRGHQVTQSSVRSRIARTSLAASSDTKKYVESKPKKLIAEKLGGSRFSG